MRWLFQKLESCLPDIWIWIALIDIRNYCLGIEFSTVDNHKIPDWLRLEGALKSIPFHLPLSQGWFKPIQPGLGCFQGSRGSYSFSGNLFITSLPVRNPFPRAKIDSNQQLGQKLIFFSMPSTGFSWISIQSQGCTSTRRLKINTQC